MYTAMGFFARSFKAEDGKDRRMNYCLGTVQFGLDYGIQGNGQPDREKVFEMLSYAIEHGVDQLDTASAYGEAEEVLGAFFSRRPDMTKRVDVVSKLKPDAFQNSDPGEWSRIAVENAKTSLKRLGIQQFSAYLFHNAGYIFDGRAVRALNAVREQGLAERIGVSVYTPEEAGKALEYPELQAIQIPYNVFDRRLDHSGFFERAAERGIRIYARSSLLQGLLMMDPERLPDRVAFAKQPLQRFREICASYQVELLPAAIGYVGNKPTIDHVVFGVDNLSQLKSYIALKDTELPDGMTEALDRAYDQVEEKLVNPVLWK